VLVMFEMFVDSLVNMYYAYKIVSKEYSTKVIAG